MNTTEELIEKNNSLCIARSRAETEQILHSVLNELKLF